MADFYDDMANMIASEMLGEFKQGTVSLKRVTTAPPDPETPWGTGRRNDDDLRDRS